MSDYITMVQFINELRAIAEQADTERLSVWLPQVEAEFPHLAAEVRRCANLPDAPAVICYLRTNYAQVNLACMVLGDQWTAAFEQSISFLYNFIKERKCHDQSQP